MRATFSVLARRSTASGWATAATRGRGRKALQTVETSSLPRLVTAVAFDQFTFDALGVTRAEGATLTRGTHPDGTVIAVGSAPWPGMPIGWTALQSRHGRDLLGLADDTMEPAGHRAFDERFAVDADDVSRFRKLFRTSLRNWLVDFDRAHGPIVVLFDGPGDDATPTTPRRRSTDPPEPTEAESTGTVFLARTIDDEDALLPTLELTAELVEHLIASVTH